MPRIFKIALTGGPCSGKTTSLKFIIDKFSSEYKVYTVPECASLIFNSGVTIIPTNFNEESHTVFTKGICRMQMDLERFFEEQAKYETKDVIIITDRGVLDNFAFCSEKVKKRVYEETGWDDNFMCVERYDQVIHLVTAAQGAEKFYTLENNVARSETPELAKHFDKRLHEEWMIHPKFTLIDNSEKGFQKKLDRVINAVSALVNNKPVANKMVKMLINCNPEKLSLPSGIKTYSFDESINYLTSQQEDRVNSVIKRKVPETSLKSFFHTEKILNLGESVYMEMTRPISVKNYMGFIQAKDIERKEIKRKVISFSLMSDRTVNVYNLEIYKFDDPLMTQKIQKLKRKVFKKEAVDDDALVILRGFTDTDRFPEGVFEQFLPQHVDVSGDTEFMISDIVRVNRENTIKNKD
jgi:nucleoside-triphosphatase THEP1